MADTVPELTPAEHAYAISVYRRAIRTAQEILTEAERLSDSDMLVFGRERLEEAMGKLSAVMGANDAGPH
jgi:hypothetical protein